MKVVIVRANMLLHVVIWDYVTGVPAIVFTIPQPYCGILLYLEVEDA